MGVKLELDLYLRSNTTIWLQRNMQHNRSPVINTASQHWTGGIHCPYSRSELAKVLLVDPLNNCAIFATAAVLPLNFRGGF